MVEKEGRPRMIKRSKYPAEFERRVITEYYSTGASQLTLKAKYGRATMAVRASMRNSSVAIAHRVVLTFESP